MDLEEEPVAKEIRIKGDRTFARTSLEQLTPWLGTCQASFDKEVYP